MKVGFIGVGNMGGPMCRNIIKNSNHDVIVYDLNDEAVKTCTDLGAGRATSVESMAGEVDVIMTSLPMPADVEKVALGPGGIAAGGKKGLVYFDLSTNSPAMVRKIAGELEKQGIEMLDAPVSGGVQGAEAATIAIMIGGSKKAFDAHLPLFQSFGANVIHTGDLGTGSIAKICNNMVAFCNMAAGAEGLMLGASAGIDPNVLDSVISNSSGNSNSYRSIAKKTLSRDFSPNFALKLAYKDMHLAMELADELGVPLSLSPQVHNLMRMARGLGHFDDDITSMIRVYERTLQREVQGSKD